MKTTFSTMLALTGAMVIAGCAGTQSSLKNGDSNLSTSSAAAALGTPVPGTRVAYDEANDPVICQKEADSMSRLKRHQVCLHKSEWEAMSDKNKHDLNDAMRTNVNPVGRD